MGLFDFLAGFAIGKDIENKLGLPGVFLTAELLDSLEQEEYIEKIEELENELILMTP